MTYSSRFWLYAPLAAFLTIAAFVMLHWWSMAGAFETKLAALKSHQAVPGITVDWDAVAVSGFPFRIDAAFTNFSVAGAGAHGPFAWTSDKFALHTLTYGSSKLIFEAAGQQRLGWSDSGGKPHLVQFLPATLRASASLDARGLARFDLDILDAGGRDFTAGQLQLHMRRDPDGHDIDLMARADAVKSAHLSFSALQAYATLTKGESLAALLRGENSWPDAVLAWRARGGAAKLSQVVAPGLAADGLLSPLY
jgi:hypothetical protein